MSGPTLEGNSRASTLFPNPEHPLLLDSNMDTLWIICSDLSGHRFLNIPSGRWMLFFAVLALALIASRFLEWFLGQRLRSLVAEAGGIRETKLLDLFTPVIRWAILLTVARYGAHQLEVPPALESFLVEVFKASYAMLVAVLASRLVALLLDGWADRAMESRNIQLRASLVPAMRKLANLFIYTLALLLILSNAGYNVGSLLAGLGLGGLAVALAAQETLANLFGSITIFMDKPFHIGDRIQFDKYDGTVETVGLRCTEIRQLDGTVAVIPNRLVSQSSLLNMSRRPAIRYTSTLSLSTDTPPDKLQRALDLLREVYRQHPLTREFTLTWRDFTANSLDIPIVYWCATTDYDAFLMAQEEINFEIKRRFDDEKISFATPPQTLYFKPA
jgi:MscS family membrane protein